MRPVAALAQEVRSRQAGMVFSSHLFLFYFLPVVLALYYCRRVGCATCC